MTQLVNMLRQVIEFIAAKIMPIQIAGISLLGWLISLIIIMAVVTFVFNQVKNSNIQINKGETESLTNNRYINIGSNKKKLTWKVRENNSTEVQKRE